VSSARAAGAAALLVLSLSACESTQDKSARLKAQGAKAFKDAKGVSISRRAQGVTIVKRAVITDPNGTAVALVLRNTGKAPLPAAPITIDVRGAGKKSLFKNDSPGLETSLTSVASLAPGQETLWVNDQVTPAGRARTVKVEVGAPKAAKQISGALPEIALEDVKIRQDPSSGTEVVGFARLKAGVAQKSLIVSCVGRKGGRIVAAGRAEIPLLTAKKHRPFHIFPIGPLKGAQLSVSAPPTVL